MVGEGTSRVTRRSQLAAARTSLGSDAEKGGHLLSRSRVVGEQ